LRSDANAEIVELLTGGESGPFSEFGNQTGCVCATIGTDMLGRNGRPRAREPERMLLLSATGSPTAVAAFARGCRPIVARFLTLYDSRTFDQPETTRRLPLADETARDGAGLVA
jgi:hypothetical protein